MIPAADIKEADDLGVPRACGDDPTFYKDLPAKTKCSPRMRG